MCVCVFHWQVWQHFPDLPPLLDIERNLSLALVNTHFSITTPMPLLPSQVRDIIIHMMSL